MDESAEQDKVLGAKDHREYIEQVDERKGRAITRGDLLTSQLSWQRSVKKKTEPELAEVSRRHSIGKKTEKART